MWWKTAPLRVYSLSLLASLALQPLLWEAAEVTRRGSTRTQRQWQYVADSRLRSSMKDRLRQECFSRTSHPETSGVLFIGTVSYQLAERLELSPGLAK